MSTESIYKILQILEENNISIVKYRKNSYLMYQGLDLDYIYVLKDGVVKISKILRDGRVYHINYLSSPSFVDLADGDNKTSSFNVRIETDSASFYAIPKMIFKEWVLKNTQIIKCVSDYHKKRLESDINRCRNMIVNGKKGAVCSFLVNLVNEFGVRKKKGILINFRVTNKDISGFCGISSTTSVNRIIKGLEKIGVLKIVGNKIMIYDLKYLEDYTNLS
ncbi:Crp/Fnr family transcriptional regulator (plasmid) [Lactococcus lactis]|uniref:Crp/Fnr family transcriptional regulator n=1 Tax=Lactococcus lactis TaxID=1358 RepID=UPI003313C096